MKIKPSKLPGNVVMELGDHDSDRLSSAKASPFNVKKILVPIDFSDCSKKALQYAIPLAKQFNAMLILLNVVPHHNDIGQKSLSEYFEPMLEANFRGIAARKLEVLADEFPPPQCSD